MCSDIVSADIPDVKILTPKKFGDSRGFFMELYNKSRLDSPIFVQDNLSLSRPRGVVRALHFQKPPFAQDKLVMVLQGAILDVAVDIRRGSPTFGQHVSVELSAENCRQLLVPVGFAHGFCTLTADTMVLYKVSSPYAPQADAGIFWNDPALGIAWPVSTDEALLSDKDLLLPPLHTIDSPFLFEQ